MTADRDITAEISTLEGLLGRARSDIANGGVIDLTPMVERINGLCSRIDRLPREDGQAFRPALVTLLDDLEGLATLLKTGLEALATELGDHGRRRHAVSAYGKGAKAG